VKREKLVKLQPDARQKLRSKLASMLEEVTELGPSVLVSATYEGESQFSNFMTPRKTGFFCGLTEVGTSHTVSQKSLESRFST
jgi:hypothetical protein